MAEILNGKEFANEVTNNLALEVAESGLTPGLAVIIVGDDPASHVYVNMKERACKKVGFLSKKFEVDKNINEEELISLIETLNNDKSIHGILLQLPLPNHLDEKKLLSVISPLKDVDGFHPVNVGKLMIGEDGFVPCTPRGIIELLKHYHIQLEGKNAVVLGRSNIVGKPMAMLLLKENCTVTICHSKTENLKEVCKNADILIVAVGKPYFVDSDFVKKDAVVVDVGVNSINSEEVAKNLFTNSAKKLSSYYKKGYVLCGDVNFESVFEVSSCITPVPGGVGPLTIAMLLKNTFESCKNLIE
jgi:methylenetetrahydrofolate dehydrogenase (NADP+)/methenyltetrahydrofolate cyclohydrolase